METVKGADITLERFICITGMFQNHHQRRYVRTRTESNHLVKVISS